MKKSFITFGPDVVVLSSHEPKPDVVVFSSHEPKAQGELM